MAQRTEKPTNADALTISRAHLVLPGEVRPGSLACDGEMIAAIDTPAMGGEDWGVDYLIPGLIELHTDNVERHFMPRPKTYWPNGLAAALAHDREIIGAGITTVFDALAVGHYDGAATPRVTLFQEMVGSIERGGELGLFKAEHRLHFRCELSDPNLMEMLTPIAQRPDLSLVSLMDHTPGQRQWRDLDALRTFMSRSSLSPEAIEDSIARRIERGSIHVPGNWQAVLDLFEDHAGLTLATHDDTTLADVRQGHSAGIQISEFPCSIEAAAEAKRLDITTIGGAPNIVRGGSHSGNVSILDLVRAGTLDALSSDYVPASLLQAAFIIGESVSGGLAAGIKTVTAAPADMVGLTDRGRITPGLRADFLRVSLVEGTPVVRAVYRGGMRVA